MATPHFGHLLRRLREERGLSQGQLASLAGLHENTVHRAELGGSCSLRGSNARELFHAIDKVAPLIPKDRVALSNAMGLPAMATHAETLQREAKESGAVKPGPDGVYEPAGVPVDVRTAHYFLDELIDRVPAAAVLSAIENFAAAWNVRLPPRLNDSSP
ncbi:MAG: transcriptional regulator, partial [Phycisphaerales bacterium]|nr:transcriptional regulator [Phycisphaerales bacterium]